MNNKIKKLIIFFTSIIFISCSNNYYIKKGNKEYNKQNFYNANLYYKMALKNNQITDINSIANIANSFYYIKDYEDALKFYEKIPLKKREYQEQLNYAKILQFNKQFDKAKQAYINLKNKKNKIYNDTTIDKFITSCNLAKNNKAPKYKQYEITKTNIDVGGESFGVLFYYNGILYSAPNPIIENYTIDNAYKIDKYGNKFKSLYFSEINNEGKILNTKKIYLGFEKNRHIGAVSYLADSNRLYFSETVVKKRKPIIKIYSIDKTDNGFINKKELEFNSNKYSCAHPSISADGKTIFFTSDKEGGYGETDIYKSEYKNGKWGKPENLGPEINTEASEMFPFIKKNGVLYFSSNGKIGYGGLDIYYALYKKGKYTHIVHKNKPLNSYADDFAYVENSKYSDQSFISSNRNNTAKNDNIYFLKKIILPPDTIKGKIYDALTEQSIAGASLCLLIDSVSGDTISRTYTDDKGNYAFIVPKKLEDEYEEHLFAVIEKEGYEDKIIEFESRYSDTDRPSLTTKNIPMKIKIKEEQILEFHNIYFDFGKADLKPNSIEILDKLIDVMKENLNMKIELSAHTDSKSSKEFNQKLSDKRAQNAKAYMISKGIISNRIIAKGYGETQLLNNCKDGVDCSEEEHAVNRRIEVKILSN